MKNSSSLIIFLLVVCNYACAETVCVGDYLLNLPGESEVALPANKYASGLAAGAGSRSHVNFIFDHFSLSKEEIELDDYFPREDDTVWGSMQFVAGVELVSAREMLDTEFRKFRNKTITQAKEDVGRTGTDSAIKRAALLKPENVNLIDGFAVYNKLYFLRGGRLFAAWYDKWEDKTSRETALYFYENLSARKMEDIPKGKGICLHMGFLKNDADKLIYSQIGATFRLKNHPEIDVFFRQKYSRENDYDPDKQLTFFWNSFYQKNAKERTLLGFHFPGITSYPSTKIAGHAGKKSFVETVYKDGSKDYGFTAYSKGDPKAGTPTLMVYVMRNSARAKGTPLPKDEFRDLAEKIADSIRLRQIH